MSDIFNNLTKIENFKIINSSPIPGESNEPYDGNIFYDDNLYYFKFNHEFDNGNAYIVYNGKVPVFYFVLYIDFDSNADDPMVSEEQ